MKKIFILSSLALIFLFSGIMTASADVGIESGDNIVISETVLDDLYVLSGNSSIDSDVKGDLYIGGGSIIVNANVDEDLVVAGGRVSIQGNVGGDLRVMGGQVFVFGDVGDDIVVAGGTVDVGSDSVVGGTILVAAGVLSMDGHVKEDIWGAIGALFLNGKVDRNVHVTIQDALTISPNARIGGDLTYSSLLEIDVPPGVVSGGVFFNQFEEQKALTTATISFLILKSFTFLSGLLIVLILVLLVPNLLMNSSKITRKHALKSFGIGVLVLIISFVASLVLMMTIVGIPIALMTFAAILVIYYLSQIFVASWLASYIVNLKKKKNLRLRFFFGMAFVLLGYNLIDFVPLVGWLINLLLFLVGVGAIFMLGKEYFDILKSRKAL